MVRSIGLAIFVASPYICESKRSQVGHRQLDIGTQPALREDLIPCPCTIWRHCSVDDIAPEGKEPGVACVASPNAVVSMGHQVQCVPLRHGGLNYYCPPVLPHKCDPGKPCTETKLAHCYDDGVCETPAWMVKERTAAFCPLTECTHAECCDEGPVLVTAAPESPTPPQDLSCAEKIMVLAEPTMERLAAYESECKFSPGDVDLGQSEFQLTNAGKAKIWDEQCQSASALQDAPDDLYADAEALAQECPDARFSSQINPVGIFGTVGGLDKIWREAPGRPPWQPGHHDEVLPPVPIEVLPPAPTLIVTTTLPPTTAAPDSCTGTYTFTLSLGEYAQTFTLGSAPEGKLENLQCDVGPYQWGTLNMKCQDARWVMTNTVSPCYDNEEDAVVPMGPGMSGGSIERHTGIRRLVDVTSVVTRVQSHADSKVRCCCNARLDESLSANRWNRGWNAKEHTGICTVYGNVNSCVRTNSETHSHWRMEGGRCIVNEEDKAEWERILEINFSKPSTRFITPNVPTVTSGQSTEFYRSCVGKHSLGECDRCTHSIQCPEGWTCCPDMKLCVHGSTQCPSRMAASCSNCYERWKPNPEECEAQCDNPNFPLTWLPSCKSEHWWWR